MEDSIANIKSLAHKIFEFLKQEKQLGAVTWLTTVFATLSVAFLKFLKFVSESGKLAYWKISSSVIDVAGDNILYDVIMTVVIAVVMLGLFLIPYFIIESRIKKINKVIGILGLVIALSVILFCGSGARDLIHNNSWKGILAFIIADILFLVMFFTPSVILKKSIKSHKSQSKPLTKKWIVIVAVAFAIFNILYCYFTSYFLAKSETNYRITTDGYAIVYETSDFYYLAKYDTDSNQLCKEQQKSVSKEGVEYTWKSNIGTS